MCSTEQVANEAPGFQAIRRVNKEDRHQLMEKWEIDQWIA
jgi:hypothetical protein